MINALIKGIFNIVLGLVNLILTPINALILTFIPDLGNIFGIIRQFFTTCFTYIGWVRDASFIEGYTISLAIAYWTFKLTAPLAVNTIKLAIKWYNSLKV